MEELLRNAPFNESIFYTRESEDAIISLFKNDRSLINKTYAGKSPLAMCIFQNFIKVFEFLYEHGADPYFLTIINGRPANLVDVAIYKDRPEILEILYKKGQHSLNLKESIKNRIKDSYFIQKDTIKNILTYENLCDFLIEWSKIEVPFSWYVRNVGISEFKTGMLSPEGMTFLDFSVFYLYKEDSSLIKEGSNFNIGDHCSERYRNLLYKERLPVELHTKLGTLEIPLIDAINKNIEMYLRPIDKTRYKVLI